MLAVLKEKAKQGVEIRIIFDGMGCMVTLPRNYAKQLEDMGIRCRIFSPIQPLLSTYQNNRDHRKITVIDGRMRILRRNKLSGRVCEPRGAFRALEGYGSEA